MRREVFIKIEQKPGERENRDTGKTFVVVEVAAMRAEEWGLRAMMALGTAGVTVPQEIASAGLIGLALVGYQAMMGAREDAVLPLWREMIPACVFYQPDAGQRMPFNEILVEEVSTLLTLRKAIMEIHTGFTLAELAQRLTAAGSAMSNSQTTSTSRRRSRR